MLAPFKFRKARSNLVGKKSVCALFCITEIIRFFRYINKNVPCACGPKVYGKSSDY